MSIKVLSTDQPKARIDHVCEHCHQPIHQGTTYRRIVCVDNGDIWTFKAHNECDDLYNAYTRDVALDEYDLVDWHDVLEWQANR